MRTILTVAVALLGAGCYDYAPVSSLTPEPGAFVAATLTDAGSIELARLLGPGVYVVRGRYLGDSDAGMQISVSSVELQRGDELSWQGETVVLPDNTVAALAQRRLSRGRSALLVGAGVTGIVASTAAFVLGVAGGTQPTGPGRPPVKR